MPPGRCHFSDSVTPMNHILIHQDFFEDKRVRRLSKSAQMLFISFACYSSAHDSAGFVSLSALNGELADAARQYGISDPEQYSVMHAVELVNAGFLSVERLISDGIYELTDASREICKEGTE
jgi:hypothetical protein